MIKICEVEYNKPGVKEQILRIDKRCYKRDVRFNEDTLNNFLNEHAKLYIIKSIGMYETIAGYMMLYIEDKECYLTSIAILRTHRDKGLGREMFDRFQIEAKKAKCKKLSLHAVNPAMIHIAEQNGFRKVRTNPNYYGKVNATLMEKVTR